MTMLNRHKPKPHHSSLKSLIVLIRSLIKATHIIIKNLTISSYSQSKAHVSVTMNTKVNWIMART